jgi:hypothetical protein
MYICTLLRVLSPMQKVAIVTLPVISITLLSPAGCSFLLHGYIWRFRELANSSGSTDISAQESTAKVASLPLIVTGAITPAAEKASAAEIAAHAGSQLFD